MQTRRTGDGVWQKKLLSVNLVSWGSIIYVYKTNTLTGKKRTTAVRRESSAFMTPELIIEELLIASARIDELKTFDVWTVLMTFFTILNLDQSYPFQNDFKNIPNKVTKNMETAFKHELTEASFL